VEKRESRKSLDASVYLSAHVEAMTCVVIYFFDSWKKIVLAFALNDGTYLEFQVRSPDFVVEEESRRLRNGKMRRVAYK
jgi:hypothetical protein